MIAADSDASKDRPGPTLAVSPPGWTAFVTAIRAGAFRR
ncbi:DUF397 domain-containing protein [Micromonospora sp. NBC_00898]|nr:DUF397 domain-containing protein [Micromonospora sp. NBC_00898]